MRTESAGVVGFGCLVLLRFVTMTHYAPFASIGTSPGYARGTKVPASADRQSHTLPPHLFCDPVPVASRDNAAPGPFNRAEPVRSSNDRFWLEWMWRDIARKDAQRAADRQKADDDEREQRKRDDARADKKASDKRWLDNKNDVERAAAKHQEQVRSQRQQDEARAIAAQLNANTQARRDEAARVNARDLANRAREAWNQRALDQQAANRRDADRRDTERRAAENHRR